MSCFLDVMFKLSLIWAVLASRISGANASSAILREVSHRKELQRVLVDTLRELKPRDITCIAVISDVVYLNIFDGDLFRTMTNVPFVMIIVGEEEDLLSPNFNTVQSLRETKRDSCNVYVIFLANGLQVSRLLKFGDRHRILDTRANYIMLHDLRLFHSELHYLWKRIVNVIFVKQHRKIIGNVKSKTWFDLLTVPFPNLIKGLLIPRRVDIWRNDRFHYNRSLFSDKTFNLYGQELNVVFLDHVPSVVVTRDNETSKTGGVEVEIFNTLSELMHFKVNMYQPTHAELHKWGQKLSNGSFSGLIGEMVSGRADAALGNLKYTPYHLEFMDLSIPYTTQCWTFMTPEALTDNSWKTLILPFKLNMWIAVLLLLLITGSIFHAMARFYTHLQDYRHDHDETPAKGKNVKMRPSDDDTKPAGLYVFDEIINSILYTYGMLLVVSLPRLPTGWSIRLLTGWYWLYCILLVVSYRASMTAILANPAPRVTIDTLQELADSKVTCGGWGIETKKFFQDSLDDLGQKISDRFEIIDDPNDAANRVAQGVYAYYDNSNFLKYISVKRKSGITMESDNSTNASVILPKTDERNLHIMSDCVVNIPISVGFHKNSPFKTLADIYIQRIVEVGLVEKWLNDAMHPIRALERNDEEIKALMNLKKFYGAFVALAIGYFLSGICLIGEIIHWNCIVKKDPKFDKYALDEYYRNKKK